MMGLLKDERRVLITSCGGLTGTYLTKHFFDAGISVIGVDMSDNVPMKAKLDGFYLVPECKDPQYIDCIKEIVDKEKVTHIIPVSSYDIVSFSEMTEDSTLGSKMLIVDYEVNNILHNKRICYAFLNKIGVETPLVLETENISFPSLCKPCEGSGSKNVIVLDNARDFDYWKRKNGHESIYMEYIAGEEFTVDCLFGKNGENFGFNIRRRVKLAGGGAVISENDYRYYNQVKYVIGKLEDYGKVVGPINFQFKIKDDKACVFDFNTRFASGGLPLTVATGFDIPQLLLDCIEKKSASKWDCKENGKKLKMIRYYDEVFV